MKIGLLQVRIPAGRYAANAERLFAAVRQAATQGADLCISPLNGLAGWPAAAGARVRHDAALHALAAELALVPQAPALLIASSCAASAEVYLLRNGQVEAIPLRMGWGQVSVSGVLLAVSAGEALPAGLDNEAMAATAGVVHLAAERYTPERRSTLVERYARLAVQCGRPVYRANAVGGSESWLWSGDSLVMDAQGRLVLVCPPWKEAVAVLDEGLSLCGTASAPLAAEAPQDTCEGLICGLRDFVADCGAQRVVLGLSGGMDSALVAALAVEALGAANVLGVLMSSPWTSKASEHDALELADQLGMETLSLPIAGLMERFASTLAPRFTGRAPDVTEENVQSRIRGVLLMALANKEGRLLLATGNKSELGVGYCTLYGDTAGALAPLGDVYKTEVYRLAAAMNSRAGRNLIPAAVFTKAPTAELRPGQTDQDNLPPYETLDAVLRELVEYGKEPAAIRISGAAPEEVLRVARLLQASEFKRRQVPPALFVSERPFGLTSFPLTGQNY